MIPATCIAVDYAVDDDGGMVEEYGGYVMSPCRSDPWVLKVAEALNRRGK